VWKRPPQGQIKENPLHLDKKPAGSRHGAKKGMAKDALGQKVGPKQTWRGGRESVE